VKKLEKIPWYKNVTMAVCIAGQLKTAFALLHRLKITFSISLLNPKPRFYGGNSQNFISQSVRYRESGDNFSRLLFAVSAPPVWRFVCK
jgi:hypothetical protein